MGVSNLETEDLERLKARIDSRDFNAELLGLDIGRIPRFFSQTAQYLREGKDANGRDKLSDLEWMLLNNPHYAARYHQAEQALVETDMIVNQTLHTLNEKIRLIDERLQNMEERASSLPDGTKVFKSRSGKAFTIDGRELSKTEAETVEWEDDSPAWEEYKNTKTVRNKAEDSKRDVERYQAEVADPLRDRMRNREFIEEKELDEFIKKAAIEKSKMLSTIEDAKNTNDIGAPTLNEARSAFGDTGLNAPNIRGHFDTARMDIPDLSEGPSTPKLSTVPKP
jgi:hypothetical protein